MAKVFLYLCFWRLECLIFNILTCKASVLRSPNSREVKVICIYQLQVLVNLHGAFFILKTLLSFYKCDLRYISLIC